MKASKPNKTAFLHLTHSLLMVQRNARVYAKLSVTVVLSFCLLLAFLAFTDTKLYNRYKEIFAQSPRIVLSSIYGRPGAWLGLMEQIENNIEDAEYYGYITLNTSVAYENGLVDAQASFLPNGDIPVYTMYVDTEFSKTDATSSIGPVRLLGEKQTFSLQDNEVIINESWYRAMIDGGATEPLHISANFDWEDGTSAQLALVVVGVAQDTTEQKLWFDPQASPDYSVHGWGNMYLSAELLSRPEVGEFSQSAQYSVWAHTASPEQVITYARALEFSTYSVMEAQQTANDILKMENTNKAYITAVILLLVGINLYSSFSNALQERRYEIGVKRALGAEKMQIVRQFLYESLSVLLFDTLLAAALVIDLMIGYKLYQTFVLGQEWIIFISGYSVMMFLVCSLSLSAVFSLIFAFQSMQVEIISNLREE